MTSKTGSQLITAFIQTKQNMQLDHDKRKFIEFQETIKTRSKKVKPVEEEKSFNQAIQLAEKFKSMDDHKISIKQFQERHDTNVKTGLSASDAQKRLKQQGPNKLSQKEGVHWSIKLLKEMVSPFAIMLWIGAILCFVAFVIGKDPSNMYLGIVICIIVVGTAFLTFYQTMKSQSIMEGFKDFIPPATIVIRDGAENTIDAAKLVVGDVVRIENGKKIPADVRIIDSQGMKVDNSSLTGQTQLLPRTPDCTDDNPLQTKNIAFFSTLNKEGTGKGIVFATGDRTFIGQIANLAATAQSDEPPLKQEIKRFIVRLSIFAIIIGAALFGAGFAIGYPAILNFVFAIGVITANVPQGLIVEVTVGLTLTAKKLSQKKVLCKNLDAVQTLGSTSCICSDKTGTLTMNKMTSTHLWYSGKLCKAQNRQKKGIDYPFDYDMQNPGFISLQQSACVGSVANFDTGVPSDKIAAIENDEIMTQDQKEIKLKDLKIQWQQKLRHMLYLDMPTTGDASQTGLIKFFQPIEDIQKIRKRYPVVRDFQDRQCRIPFNSTNKYAYSINHYVTGESYYCVFLKGAPQKIWKLCNFVDVNGAPVNKTANWQEQFDRVYTQFGKNGQRVLGFAKIHLPKDKYPQNFKFNIDKDDVLKNLCFVGCLSLTDPPRDAVPNAVLKCRSAGVKVVMVTGDHPLTATSIARLCNIVTQETVNQIAQRTGRNMDECFGQSNAIVIVGDDLTQMALEDEGLPQSQQGKKLQKWLSKQQIVFARTSPAQKLVIVKGSQKRGQVVAVTGDGVNDSPAIKKADIGISMGITGTDVAKEAADMILLNDDFSAIVVGIEEGRKIYDNLKKSICYALTSQIAQMLPFVGFVIFQFPVPVTTVIVLYISIGTDLIPAIAFAYEPGELDIMTRRPRSKQEHMVTMTLMAQSYGYCGWMCFWGSLFTYYVVANDFGFPPAQMQGIASADIFVSNAGDVYNPTSPTFGNSAIAGLTQCPGGTMIDWIFTKHSEEDLRMTLLTCEGSGVNIKWTQLINWGPCQVQQLSPFTNKPVCYTTQAIKYAQGGYFYATVIGQIFNSFICKTRKLSVITQGLSNTFLTFSICTQIMLMLLIAYFYPFNVAFGTRDNIFMHFGIPTIPFGIFNLLVDQVRKYVIRSRKDDEHGKPHWFTRAALW